MPSYNGNFKESNVNYINKDFQTLKNSLMDYAKSYFPDTYRDFNETSPGMMLIEMSAYVGDVMSFYIDQQYREMMLPLAEERRNVVNMAKMFGYKTKPIVPAYVELTFTQDVSSVGGAEHKVNYNTAGTFDKGIQVQSSLNSDIIFETLEELDFTITGSDDTSTISSTDADGLVSTYKLSRTVRAISGQTKTKIFDVGAPTKFLNLTISDTNVIDILSVTDSNGSKWYEVDYLAQDKVPIETHYRSDETRDYAYSQLADSSDSDSTVIEKVAVPYSLQYIHTEKRFMTEVNEDNTTSLIFGNGILKNQSIESGFLDLEQVGISLPGTGEQNLTSFVDPLLGDDYASLGETPNNTTLTVEYRVGGGIESNLPVGDITTISGTPVAMNGSTGTIDSVTNNIPARGGKDEDSIEDIRQRATAFFSTQNRAVTKEDYEARILNMPSKFGNIAKVYVTRGDDMVSNYEGNLTTVGQLESVPGVVTQINDLLAGAPEIADDLSNLISNITDLQVFPPDQAPLEYDTGIITAYILSYDTNKNLVGNPHASDLGTIDGIPDLLLNNIKSYLGEYKILTDDIIIQDGYIINFGVEFDVVATNFVNKSEVKLRCIEKIRQYFDIDKMQFNQPIYTSQLMYELLGVDGVRGVNDIRIVQDFDISNNGIPNPSTDLFSFTYTGGEGFTSSETTTYGYKYDFTSAIGDNSDIILPASLSTPSVFELKKPNQNIRGVVR